MRIVDANPFFSQPWGGGIGTRVHEECMALANRGHDAFVLTAALEREGIHEPIETSEYGYRIARVPSKVFGWSNPPYIRCKNVDDMLKKIDPDIIIHNYRWAPSFDNAVLNHDGCKKVYVFHNTWGEGTGVVRLGSKFYDALCKKKLKKYDGYIAVSDFLKDQMVSIGFPEDRIAVIDNIFTVKKRQNRGDKNFIFNIGRMIPHKGIRYLVEAMKQVDSRCIIAGDGPERQKLQKYVENEGLEDKIEFPGYISNEQRDEYMSTCSLFVLPSLREAYGITAVEAISYGKPVVASDVDGVPCTVGGAGHLVEAGNADALAEGINTVLNDTSYREQLMTVAEGMIGEKTANQRLDAMEKLLSELSI